MSRTTFFDSYKYQDRRIGRGLRLGSTNSKVYMATLSRVQRDLILNFESGSFKMAESAFNELPMTLKKKNWLDYWLLVTATKRGHIPLIQFLIRNRCRVRIPIEIRSSCTPLYYAIRLNDQSIVDELTVRGARNIGIDFDPEVPFRLAMQDQDIKVIDLVLCNYNFASAKPQCKQDIAVFHLACWRGNLAAVELFVGREFKLDSRSMFVEEEFSGFSPLHFAMEGTLEVITYLIENKADFHAINQKGETPLHLAFKRSEQTPDFVDKVVGKYARIEGEYKNVVDEVGLSHFHVICSSNADEFTEIPILDQPKKEHLNMIQYFLDKLDVDIDSSVVFNHETYPGYTALHFAVNRLFFEVSELLLVNGANPNKCGRGGLTPLHLLCKKYPADTSSDSRVKSIVELLLNYGADAEIEDSQKCLSLHYAFCQKQNSNHELIDLLLSRIERDHINVHGLSCLHIACASGNLSKVETLISSGASIDVRINPDSEYHPGFSPIHFAVMYYHKDIVRYLLEHGADVNYEILESKMTPLHLACSHPYTSSFQFGYPCDKGFRCGAEGNNSQIHRKNRIDIIELLLEHQASTSIRDSSGNSAMSYACQFPLDEIMKSCDDFRCGSHYRSKVLEEVATRQKIIIDMFLKYGADIHHCDDAYKFTLHMIIDKIGDHDVYPMKKNLVEFFLERGTDVNAVNGAGLTLLHVAIERSMTDYSHATLVDLLLKYRADVNAKSSDGKLNTPLHHAAELYSKPYHMKVIIMLLRELDIDLNSQNSDGETALHIATKRHLSLLISKLLRHGADISVENVNGDTPFSFLYDWVRENPEEFRPGVDETFASSYRFLDNGSLVFRCIVHMKRLIKLKSHMSKKAESYLEKLFPHRPEGAPEIDGKIDQQVELMKQTRIDSFTSLYDILLKDPTEIVIHLKNENFKKMILSSKFKTKFSRFHVMLTLQYELALARSTMLEDAKKTLNILFKCDWPDSCSEHVLMYLTNADLRKMIELEPNKRIRKRRLGEDLLELDSMIFPKVIKVEPQIEPEIEPEIEPGIELVTIED